MRKPPDRHHRPHRPGSPVQPGRRVQSRVILSPLSRSSSGQGRLRWDGDLRRGGPAGADDRHKPGRMTQGVAGRRSRKDRISLGQDQTEDDKKSPGRSLAIRQAVTTAGHWLVVNPRPHDLLYSTPFHQSPADSCDVRPMRPRPKPQLSRNAIDSHLKSHLQVCLDRTTFLQSH